MNRIALLLLLLTVAGAEEGVAAAHPYFATAAKALVSADGKKAGQSRLLTPKYTLIYFSAHWCPPCRAFTPKLVQFYNEHGGGKDFEVLFISSDEDAVKMLGYMSELQMPWVGLRYGSSKTAEIKTKYTGGDGIPNLVVVDENDKVVFSSYVNGEYVGPSRVLQQFTELLPKK